MNKSQKKGIIITIISLLVIAGIILGITLRSPKSTKTTVKPVSKSKTPQLKEEDKKLSFEIVEEDGAYKVKESTSYLDKTITYIDKEIKGIEAEGARIIALDSRATNFLSKIGVPLVGTNNSPFLVSSLTENRIKYDTAPYSCGEDYTYFSKADIKELIGANKQDGCYSATEDVLTFEEGVTPEKNTWPRNDLEDWEIQNFGFSQKIDKDVISAIKPNLIVYSTEYAAKFPDQIDRLKSVRAKKIQINLENEQDHFALLSTIGKKFGSEDATGAIWEEWISTFEDLAASNESMENSETKKPKVIFLYRLRDDIYHLGSDSYADHVSKQMNVDMIMPEGKKSKKIALDDLESQKPNVIVHLVHPIRSKADYEDNMKEYDYLQSKLPNTENFYSSLSWSLEYNSPSEIRKVQEFIVSTS